jgi:cell division protein ZapA
MAQLTIRINGYAYAVACEDGQEPHLERMAAEIDARITSIKASAGYSGEARLLLMAALLLADELHDTRNAAPVPAPAPIVVAPKPDAEARAKLRRIAARAEEIAADLTEG